MHSARLLESLGSNTDFASKFVDQGGLKQLLRLYTLKHLPPTFGSSSAAHALVAAVRVLNQGAVSSVTNRVVETLTGQLRTTLLLGMVSSVPSTPPVVVGCMIRLVDSEQNSMALTACAHIISGPYIRQDRDPGREMGTSFDSF